MRRTAPPSAEIKASIDKLLGKGAIGDPGKTLGELARLAVAMVRPAAEPASPSVALGSSDAGSHSWRRT